MNVLDLFSGIGGFSLGLERAGGFRTVAFCECEPYAQRVLAKHWPGVPIYPDVRELGAARLAADGITADIITAGFPCQDISMAGRGAGLAGERSGLWREVARLVGELRPRYAILENVSALLHRGLGDVLGDLAEIGYDAEWHCIPASAVGAPHQRDRIWIVAHPGEVRRNAGRAEQPLQRAGVDGEALLADAASVGQQGSREPFNASNSAAGQDRKAASTEHGGVGSVWSSEPDVGRVANGVPYRVDRLGCLGNAVVPQIPEIIGRAILAAEMTHTVREDGRDGT
jgi:DNA (cytosine-5)-methyltransferase 1